MKNKIKTVSFILTLAGLIGILLAALAYVGIIIIVPDTSMAGSGEGSGLLIAPLFAFGSIAALSHFIIGLPFLLLHIGHYKNKRGDGYVWILFFLSAIAATISAIFLFNLFSAANGHPFSDFAKLFAISTGCGTVLPFSLTACGCILNIASKARQNKSI